MTSKFRIVLATLVGAAVGGAAIHGLSNRIMKMQEGVGGRNFRTGGGKITGMEGPPPPQRVAITEWDNLDKAQAFFESKEWADLGPERDKALKTIRRYAVEVRD